MKSYKNIRKMSLSPLSLLVIDYEAMYTHYKSQRNQLMISVHDVFSKSSWLENIIYRKLSGTPCEWRKVDRVNSTLGYESKLNIRI